MFFQDLQGASPEERAEAQRQYNEVYSSYHGKDGEPLPGWLKAPNGKDTRLTERQWVQVRTPFFKRYFGDWEAAALIDMAQRAWNGDKTAARFNFAPSEKLKAELKKRTGQDLQQVFITDSDIRHIKNQHSQNEGSRGQVDISPEDIALIPFVMNEFDSAETGKPDNKGNSRVEFRKQIDGTAVAVSIERGAGKEQVVSLWKMKNRVPHANALSGTSETTPATHIIQQAEALRKARENVSKIVDENGEPLVVYHGPRSAEKFDVFHGKAAFFTDSRETAEVFHSEHAYRLVLNGEAHTIDLNTAEDIKNSVEPNESLEWAEGFNLLDADYARESLVDTLESLGYETDGIESVEIQKSDSGVMAVFLNIRNPKTVDYKGKTWGETGAVIEQDFDRSKDGFIARNLREGGLAAETLEGNEMPIQTTYVTFSPNQIKSATGNAGTFSGNPSILYQSIEGATPEERAEARRQFEAVKAAYSANSDALRLAPNGERIEGEFWDENPDALVWIRTPNFKRYFGDWETAANAAMPRSAKSVEQAAETIRKAGIIGKPLKNTRLGIEATISGNSLDEMTNETATKASVNPRLHALAVANIDRLFETAAFEVTHPDTHGREEVEATHRLGALMRDGDEYVPVMITAIEFKDPKTGSRIYTVKAIDVEKNKSAGQLVGPQNETQTPIADFNTRIAQLIEEVKGKVSKIVDKNGVPLPVYHATNEEFTVFDLSHGGENTRTNVEEDSPAIEMAKIGHWFNEKDLRKNMASSIVMPVFLNIRNPETESFDSLWGQAFETNGDDLRDDYQRDGFDGLIIDDTEFGNMSFVAFFPNQIKSATNNAGTYSGNPSILYQSIGEAGAEALDRAEEAGTRMDSLAVARQMEEAGKDARAVRLATGWERGADRKWRYEIPDGEIKRGFNGKMTLGEYYHNEELYKAYPQLRNMKLFVEPLEKGADGFYRPGKPAKETKWGPVEATEPEIHVDNNAHNAEAVLIHEIQHAIQDIEGFAQGATLDTARKLLKEGDGLTPYKVYERVAGEVEARNAELRLGMSAAERLSTLLADTEDVARDEQVFLYNSVGAQAMQEALEGEELRRMEAEAYREGLKSYQAGTFKNRLLLRASSGARGYAAHGLKNGEIQLPTSVIKKATDPDVAGHDVREETIRELPELLARPLAVIKSKTEPNSILAVIDAKDRSGRQVVVPMSPNKGRNANTIRSVYGKDNFDGWLHEQIAAGRVLFADKNKAATNFRQSELQLLQAEVLGDFNSSISQSETMSRAGELFVQNALYQGYSEEFDAEAVEWAAGFATLEDLMEAASAAGEEAGRMGRLFELSHTARLRGLKPLDLPPKRGDTGEGSRREAG
ncbi:MAG: hypothetical protein LBR23_06915 [Spirochaetaceae bacterium]|nr:hypothetical protein [Spirochaetaceae bacterium]